MINWKVRLKNVNFWLALIPAILLVVSCAASALGVTVDLTEMQAKIVALIKAIFALLAVLGIVNDPTTAGLGDSGRAMSYDRPWEDN